MGEVGGGGGGDHRQAGEGTLTPAAARPARRLADLAADAVDQLLLGLERLGADAEADQGGVAGPPVRGSIGATWRGRRRAAVGAPPWASPARSNRKPLPPEEVRKGRPMADARVAAVRMGAGEPVLTQHTLLEPGHPANHRWIGKVGGFDADVQLSRHPGHVLEFIQVLDFAEVLGDQRRGCPTGSRSGSQAPAQDGQGQADAKDSPGWAMG